MENLSTIKNVYLIGIGGIGMSALARYFHEQGCSVSGYDKTETALTRQLQQEGIKIYFKDEDASIDKHSDLIIYTPAIPKDHLGLNFYRAGNYNLLKRSEVLGLLSDEHWNICVGGTHGKTTTSSMAAHILRNTQKGCTAFLGGIAANYKTNYWSTGKDIFVLEADEYDRSFHKLKPVIAIITAMDADHLDIYGTPEAMQDAFIQFGNSVSDDGCLIIHNGLSRINDFTVNKLTYSLESNSDCHVENLKPENGSYNFDVVINGKCIKGFKLNMGGLHNVENALAAIIACKLSGASDDELRNGIESYKGVKRRFEYVVKEEGLVIIDDYAHHPEELNALINGARDLFPELHMTIVFQPHLFSRTKDFAAEFGAALSKADDIILLPIYPAREKPMQGVTSELLMCNIENPSKVLVEKEELETELNKKHRELILIAGAGDIDAMVDDIKKQFKNKHEA